MKRTTTKQPTKNIKYNNKMGVIKTKRNGKHNGKPQNKNKTKKNFKKN